MDSSAETLTQPTTAPLVHPCVKCGACCAYFRVLFDPNEIKSDSFNVPKELTERVDPKQLAILGTNQAKPRCVALGGHIGKSVGCTIYDRRPSCCREFVPSFEQGYRNPRCDQARKSKGLKPLRLADYAVSENPPSTRSITAPER